MPVRAFLLSVVLAVAWALVATADAADENTPAVQHVDLVHLSHTDIGFTDHPLVCREMQRRYLDIAIDAVLASRDKPAAERFSWTAEATISVADWWRAASPERREDFLKAVKTGQLDVTALAMNNTPFLDARQWQTMLHWLPEDLWRRVHPSAAVQDDVNGFPRAGALALLDCGVHRLLMGINTDSGGTPFPCPSAFWWKMPDGRRLFVYQGFSYPAGYDFFEPNEWRRGPVPQAGDARYRPPRPGDILRSDDASVRAAHRCLVDRVRRVEAAGYHYPRLLLSITNQWRIDNDPPFPPLADFVAAWNRLGLKPSLRLTTAADALERMEKAVGDKVPEHQGEWTDWWANGAASAPREVAASRAAKRSIAAALSPVWGKMSDGGRRIVDESLRELCLFDEHTWGSGNSVGLPYSLDTQGQFNEKAAMAYRPMARAEWLVGERMRTRLAAEPEGLYVANTAPRPWSGWVRMPVMTLRDDYRSVEDTSYAGRWKMYWERGLRPFSPPQNPGELTRENSAATYPDNAERQVAKFWVESLPGESIRRLRLSTKKSPDDAPAAAPPPTVTLDPRGWPASIVWPGMSKPLFLPGLGEFLAMRAKGFKPRWAAREVFDIPDPVARTERRRELFEETTAQAKERATVEDNPHTLVYTQYLEHPRLHWAVRRLEVWKSEPRVALTFRLNRISSESPETLFLAFPLPCESTLPETSCGGVPFVPFRDQLPGTCRDYFAIDGWVHYATPAGHWIWVSRDAPLVTFGGPQTKARRTDPPEATHRVLAMIFDNFWYTNFVADSHGAMEFRFDLTWRKDVADSSAAARIADTLAAEPSVLIQPSLRESPVMLKRLFEP